jgi:hypothetical protein
MKVSRRLPVHIPPDGGDSYAEPVPRHRAGFVCDVAGNGG